MSCKYYRHKQFRPPSHIDNIALNIISQHYLSFINIKMWGCGMWTHSKHLCFTNKKHFLNLLNKITSKMAIVPVTPYDLFSRSLAPLLPPPPAPP
jgi:hypothetical protein